MNAVEYYAYWDSPLGRMLLVASDSALTGVHFVGEKYYPAICAAWRPHASANFIVQARLQLAAYFAGERKHFDLVVEPPGTPFQRRVWRALQDIPHGVTENYGAVARRVGEPNASRAVGAANGRNPISIVIPCHRVIGANGDLTGYAGGLARKAALLRLEAEGAGEYRLTPN